MIQNLSFIQKLYTSVPLASQITTKLWLFFFHSFTGFAHSVEPGKKNIQNVYKSCRLQTSWSGVGEEGSTTIFYWV